MSINKNKKDWESMARLDPLWAILSLPEKKFNKWDLKEFFLSGTREIQNLMKYIKNNKYLKEFNTVLDFGCGVGRCTRAFSKYFKSVSGVDISENMILKAKEFNRSFKNCKFIVNDKDDLNLFSDDHYNLIYSNIVLQHLPNKLYIKKYLQEFIRILKPGGLLIFQLPSYIPLINRIQLRRRLNDLLKLLRINEELLYNKLFLHPIKLISLSEKKVIRFLKNFNIRIIEVQPDPLAGHSIKGKRYFIKKI